MPYQNNNNRVNPQATGKYKINPVASPVDKQLKYQVDLSSAERTQNIANALSQIGQGVYDFANSDYMKKKAEEEAIILHTEDMEKGNNQHEWKEASKRISGISKFNPHIKDRYMELAAAELFNKSKADLLSLADFYKHSNDDVLKHIQAQKNELKAKMQQIGLSSSTVAPQLKAFEALCDEYYINYIDKNAEYTHNLSYGMEAANMTSQFRQVAYGGKDKQYEGFKTTLDTIVSDFSDRGGTAVDILSKTVYPALKSTISQIASDPNATLQLADLLKAAREVEVDGMKLADITPNFEYELRQDYYTAYQQRTIEEDMEYKEMVRKNQINAFKAEKEFTETFYNNPEMSLAEAQDLAISVAQKYGVTEKVGSFLTSAHSVQQMVYNWHNTKSDPDSLKAINLAWASGELTPKMLQDYLIKGQLSSHDFMSYMDRINREEAAEQKALATVTAHDYKNALTQVEADLKDKSFQKAVKESMGNKAVDEIAAKVNDIKDKVATGELPIAEASTQLQRLLQRTKTGINKFQNFKNDISNFKPIDLMKSEYFTKLPINVTCNKEQAERAIIGMNMFRNKEKVGISSMINPARMHPTLKVVKPHTGTDVSVPVGTPVYLPQGFTGTVIASGNGADTGIWSLVRLEPSGDFIKALHLSKAQPAGTKIGYNTVWAYSGNTGRGTGAHIHLEFYESDGSTLYDPYAFVRQIQQPSKANKKQ